MRMHEHGGKMEKAPASDDEETRESSLGGVEETVDARLDRVKDGVTKLNFPPHLLLLQPPCRWRHCHRCIRRRPIKSFIYRAS